VPLGIAAIVVVTNLGALIDDVEHMPRVVVPGQGTVKLAAGDYVVYGETDSHVDGVAYINGSISVSCTLAAADGSPITLESRTGTTTYTLGGYQGRSMYDVAIPRTGEYRLTCEGDQKPAVLAIGHGFAKKLVVAILTGILGLMLTGGVVVVIFLKRRKKK
jgi:hypothetical protein